MQVSTGEVTFDRVVFHFDRKIKRDAANRSTFSLATNKKYIKKNSFAQDKKELALHF